MRGGDSGDRATPARLPRPARSMRAFEKRRLKTNRLGEIGKAVLGCLVVELASDLMCDVAQFLGAPRATANLTAHVAISISAGMRARIQPMSSPGVRNVAITPVSVCFARRASW